MEINKQIKKIVDKLKKKKESRENLDILKKTRENMEKWKQEQIEKNLKEESFADTFWGRWFK